MQKGLYINIEERDQNEATRKALRAITLVVVAHAFFKVVSTIAINKLS